MSMLAFPCTKEPAVGTKDDLFYAPWVQSASPSLSTLIDRLHAQLEQKLHDPTKRKSRMSAVSSRREALSSVITNLMRLHEVSSLGAVLVVPLGRIRKDRYTQKQFPAYLVTEMIDELEDLGVLVRNDYEYRRICTTIKPTEEFAKLAATLGSGPHVGRYAGEETIHLKKPVGRIRYTSNQAPKEVKNLVDYADCPTTRRMRADMAIINKGLEKADIRFLARPVGGSFMVRHFSLPRDMADSSFKWDREGRLYGGFWQNMRKDMRKFIELDGEPLCDLDFKSMHVALAYRLSYAAMAEGDPYVGIKGLCGESMQRDDAKAVMANLLHRSTCMTSFPRDRDLVSSLRMGGWEKGRDLQAAVERRHPAIAQMFGRALGLKLMWIESEILVTTLLRLAAEGVSALSLHDGIMCGRSQKGNVVAAMRSASSQVLAGMGLGAKPLEIIEKAIDVA